MLVKLRMSQSREIHTEGISSATSTSVRSNMPPPVSSVGHRYDKDMGIEASTLESPGPLTGFLVRVRLAL